MFSQHEAEPLRLQHCTATFFGAILLMIRRC
jgi:hypothetical protein